ncbi:MAG: iron ABC transporter permease [Alphaproteobacteria bacterium]|nr:iron ABC transporter permease [Alphaproteobacteria bacterium]
MSLDSSTFTTGTAAPSLWRGLATRRVEIGWSLGSLALAGVVALPVLAVAWLALQDAGGALDHLYTSVLPEYVANTLILMIGVAVGVLLIGVSTAWLVVNCRFPGRRLFEWALLLPFAVPAYILAFTLTDLLEYSGSVQIALRELFGWTSKADYWFPDIRSMPSAILVLSLVLYPYVYLLSRAAFMEQCVCVLEAGRTLGHGPWRGFFRLALPMARPSIVVGLTLALMETISDFGTVSYFAINTFTTGIYSVWLNMYSAPGAARLSLFLLGFVLALILLERWSRRGQRYNQTGIRYRPLPGYELRGWRRWAAVAACALPIALGFGLPATVLLENALTHADAEIMESFLADLGHSLELAALAGAVTVLAALFLAYGLRNGGNRAVRGAAAVAALGYALPGSVIAVGVLIPFGFIDNTIDRAMEAWFGIDTGLLLSGTVFAMVFAYLARFMAVSLGTVEASLQKVTPSIDGVSRTLGHGPFSTLARVHAPLIKGSVLTALILVFVDVLKELPASLILRPFGFNTLAIRAYELASDELLEQASIWALAIVAAGLIPVILLSLAIRRSRPGHSRTC